MVVPSSGTTSTTSTNSAPGPKCEPETPGKPGTPVPYNPNPLHPRVTRVTANIPAVLGVSTESALLGRRPRRVQPARPLEAASSSTCRAPSARRLSIEEAALSAAPRLPTDAAAANCQRPSLRRAARSLCPLLQTSLFLWLY